MILKIASKGTYHIILEFPMIFNTNQRCFVSFALFTPSLLTALFNMPRNPEQLVLSGDPCPPESPAFCEQAEGASFLLSPDPLGLCGQPKRESCHRLIWTTSNWGGFWGFWRTPSGRFKSCMKTQASASCRACLDIHGYVYGYVHSKSDQWNDVK